MQYTQSPNDKLLLKDDTLNGWMFLLQLMEMYDATKDYNSTLFHTHTEDLDLNMMDVNKRVSILSVEYLKPVFGTCFRRRDVSIIKQ